MICIKITIKFENQIRELLWNKQDQPCTFGVVLMGPVNQIHQF